MTLSSLRSIGLLAAAGLISVTGSMTNVAKADWEPTQTIEMVTHSGAGSGIDLYLREIARIWQEYDIVPVSVRNENRTGARGDRARRYVVEENAGNPHVIFGMAPSQVNNAVLMGGDVHVGLYTPIGFSVVDPLLMVVNADSEYETAVDVIEAARERPGEVLMGGGPFGNVPSLVSILMQEALDIEFTYTPFEGGGQALTALLGGHVDFILEGPNQANQHVAAGTLRIVGSSVPLEAHPDVQTFEEQGLEFQILAQYRGMVSPPEVPEEAAEYYRDALRQAVETPDWQAYVENNDLVPYEHYGDDMHEILFAEEEAYRRLSAQLGLD